VSVNATIGGSATGFTGNIAGVENLTGGDGNDTLIGDSGSNTLSGGSGNDTLIGGAGRDTLTGGGNNDTFVVNAMVGSASDSGRVVVQFNNNDTGQDSITDFDFTNDTIQVVATNVSNFTHGTDTFVGTATGNKNDGSAGSFFKTVGLVNHSHDASTQVIGNGDVAITFASNVTESSFEARIKYDLTGTGNSDTITTGALNDKLTGGAGADTLTGGGGADTFVFTNLTVSLVASSSRDTIMDFVSGTDFFQIGHALNGFTDLTGSAFAGSGNLANDILSLLNSGNLAANSAAEVKIAGSSYVVINDGTAGFNSASDAVIKLNNNAVLHVGDFIV
jgi:Ca2+-binding RTX toxin-like protein